MSCLQKVIMKTEPSYNFQHSLLTREGIHNPIMKYKESQSWSILIRRVGLISHLSSIYITTNIVIEGLN